MAYIFIVEDEDAISDLIAMNLSLAGHTYRQIYDGNELLPVLEKDNPDMILLDVMLPGKDGFSLMESIRQKGIPVIFLTAKDSIADRVKGLRLGADDYLIKPFAAIELLARVEAVLRRTKKACRSFQLGRAEVKFDERIAIVDGQPVELTAREFDLLEVLIQNRNLALSREKLLELAWGYDYLGETRTVDVHVQKLRKKLGWENFIKTVYKVGYRLEAPR